MKETKKEAVQKETAAAEQKAETVTVYLPREGIGDALEGCYNGVNFRIPTEQSVQVPKRIAALIKDSRRQLKDSGCAVQSYRTLGGRKLG